MSAPKSHASSSAAVRRTALRRAATISLGLGVAALPVIQSTGASLVSDLESADAELDLADDEMLIEEDDEFADATLIQESDEIDGPGKYELEPEDDDPDHSGASGDSGDAPRGDADDEVDDDQGEVTTE